MKHKHAEVIHAWADGATIEYFNTLEQQWQRLDGSDFYPQLKYRVKPAEKVVRWLWLSKQHDSIWYVGITYMTEKQAHDYFAGDGEINYKKLEWSREKFDE